MTHNEIDQLVNDHVMTKDIAQSLYIQAKTAGLNGDIDEAGYLFESINKAGYNWLSSGPMAGIVMTQGEIYEYLYPATPATTPNSYTTTAARQADKPGFATVVANAVTDTVSNIVTVSDKGAVNINPPGINSISLNPANNTIKINNIELPIIPVIGGLILLLLILK